MTARAIPRHGPPSHGGRPSAAASEQISARILEAARLLFLRDGFAETSMDSIAAEIGISKRTLYARHESKAALFEAMVVEFVKANAARIATQDLAGRSVREALRTLAERILAVATDPLIISLERVVTGESRQFPELAELIYQHGGEPLRKEVADLLREAGADEAELARDAEIFLAIVIFPSMRQAVLQRTAPGLAGVDRAFVARAIDIFIRGTGLTS
jgi:TetR/AcrR family transcriptional regulator, regulator of autoinduction and epiphytic fitness